MVKLLSDAEKAVQICKVLESCRTLEHQTIVQEWTYRVLRENVPFSLKRSFMRWLIAYGFSRSDVARLKNDQHYHP